MIISRFYKSKGKKSSYWREKFLFCRTRKSHFSDSKDVSTCGNNKRHVGDSHKLRKHEGLRLFLARELTDKIFCNIYGIRFQMYYKMRILPVIFLFSMMTKAQDKVVLDFLIHGVNLILNICYFLLFLNFSSMINLILVTFLPVLIGSNSIVISVNSLISDCAFSKTNLLKSGNLL